MITVEQTDTDTASGTGNCLQACLASLLELPIEDVPHFVLRFGSNWFEELDRWLWQRFGLAALLLKFTGPPAFTRPSGYCIASGPAPGFPKHSVVWKDGDIVYDPHPDRPGLVQITDLIVFTAPDPHGVSPKQK